MNLIELDRVLRQLRLRRLRQHRRRRKTSLPPLGGTIALQTRKWRNWQTHQLEGLAVAIPCRFKSYLPHILN